MKDTYRQRLGRSLANSGLTLALWLAPTTKARVMELAHTCRALIVPDLPGWGIGRASEQNASPHVLRVLQPRELLQVDVFPSCYVVEEGGAQLGRWHCITHVVVRDHERHLGGKVGNEWA